jgi:hypothetical protein
MATTYEIQQLLVKEAGRIGPEIYRRTVDTSAWLKLTKQEQFPEEMGDVISSVTFERFYPSSSIADTTAGGYAVGDINGDAGAGWRVLGSNPIDQTYTGFNPYTQTLSGGSNPPVSSSSPSSTAGNALPKPLTGVSWGQKLRQYSLKWASVDSPDIALEDLRFAVKRKEQLSNIMDVLSESTSLVWQDRYRQLYTEQVAVEGNLVIPSASTIGILPVTSSGANGYSVSATDLAGVYSAVTAGSGDSASTFSANSLPQSQLTQGILKRLYMKLIRDGAGTQAMGRENGAPVFMLICGAETSESLIRLNADIRQDFRYAKPNELLTPLGIERSYGGFYHSIDPYPPRFNVVTATTPDKLIRVFPFRRESLAGSGRGFAYNINPVYETATYEVSYIFHQDVMRSVVPSPISVGNKMGFNAQNYRGEFKWVNILDRAFNPDGNVGYFRGVLASGARPVFPQYGYVILHTRPNISLDYVS